MRALRLICVCFFTMITFILPKNVFSKFANIHKRYVSLASTFETKNCFASYVIIDGKEYLVKQKKDFKKQLAVVRDALAAYIAKDLNIAHEVTIISGKAKFPGKIRPDWPATLHTIAPGETVRVQRQSKYSSLRLKQQWAKAQSFSEKGLTETIINNMSWHWQLPVIVALDLIIGNSDRHCGNLCYDPETDSFCAIDMDDTFNKDLCELAYEKIKLMQINKVDRSFSRQEIEAILQMRNTLKFLVRKHKPQELIAKLRHFAYKAGFSKGGKFYNDSVRRKLLFYESMIVQSNESAHKLIALLDRLLSYRIR